MLGKVAAYEFAIVTALSAIPIDQLDNG